MKHLMRDEFVKTACFGKQQFSDRQLARKVAARRQGRNIYKCQVCGFWHVGNKQQQRRPKRRGMSGGREYERM